MVLLSWVFTRIRPVLTRLACPPPSGHRRYNRGPLQGKTSGPVCCLKRSRSEVEDEKEGLCRLYMHTPCVCVYVCVYWVVLACDV